VHERRSDTGDAPFTTPAATPRTPPADGWPPADVLRAAADWTWVPDGAEVVTGDVRVVRYPEWFSAGVLATQVDSARSPAELVDEVVERTRAWGSRRLGWWVTAGDRPVVEDELRRRGAVHEDTVAVLALPLDGAPDHVAPSLAVPDGVTAELVRTAAQLREVDAVNVPVWGQQPLTPERLDADLAELRRGLADGTGFRVLARLDGRAVATGGVTLADPPAGWPQLGRVARLWGAATLPDARGRGAYRAVLAARLARARSLGASVALVQGRTGTSAPVLTRAGFRKYGEERLYGLAV
jgi:GNAT superfamily N-acetyltransferase